jgi:exosortase A-associated hydrolase 1/exosortase A-associated hydrolase 2
MNQLQTFFLPGPLGSLHVALFYPETGCASSHWVIHVPAFGEEMNKSRGMIARQARVLAAQGMTVVVADLIGTGDSEASLEEVTWQAWKADVVYLAKWARKRGAGRLTLWGHRLGCLLAAEVAQDQDQSLEQLLFWQPVHSGKQHLAQFLRLRVAAALTSGGAETVAGLRERLLRGKSVEVAGYTLSGRMYSEIEAVVLAGSGLADGIRVRIVEVVTDAGRSVLPITAKLVEQWSEAGIDCQVCTASGAPFWMTQELAFSSELLDKTAALMLQENEKCVGTALTDVTDLSELPSSEISLGMTPSVVERSLVFYCEQKYLVGILHQPITNPSLGVLIVVGGPQYRVGSHRQFVYLARSLAGEGIPAFRFDYRGMGDSDGELQGFEHISLDIGSAIDAMQTANPSISNIVLWGLCDAATASVFYAGGDPRVKGLVLVNPWIYSVQGAAKAYLKHYYLRRLFQRDFWRKVFSGNFAVSTSIKSAATMLKGALTGSTAVEKGDYVADKTIDPNVASRPGDGLSTGSSTDLVTRFADKLSRFTGDVFVILSGKDLTAAEFIDATRSNRKLRRAMKCSNVSQASIPEADHTFSRGIWRTEVEMLSASAIKQFTTLESNQ